MPDTKHGGRREGAGRKPGSKSYTGESAERTLLALAKSVEDSIREKDFKTAKEHSAKLAYILSFIPDTPSA